ncbi:accessory gene regulator B family protein [Anaerovorax odorimutans]|uniref:Accessory gene regulator B family protein n=1 Tax=Anaerovorax odorimutans TaxID=109327 RepID=A0ABT1RTE6_9FIRM|nr:accessory gene regulator B family protein [Anaerovorax odorimutans]MCQ4638480.1 accessory gene regulator B family protein [Anaerovorax odorimutans]
MKRIDNLLNSIGIRDQLTIIKIKYGLEIIRSELSKILFLLIIFVFLNKSIEYVFALSILSPIRCFSGGLHLKTNIGCFLFSLLIYTLIIIALPNIPLPIYIYYLLLIISFLIILVLSPVYTKKRPIQTKERYLFLKRRTVLISIVCFLIIVSISIIGYIEVFIIGCWVMVVQASQLIIAKKINWKEALT